MRTVLYYDMLQFQPGSLDLLEKHFEVVSLPDPDFDSLEILQRIDATFAPLGFFCGKEKIDACPNLKAIASNTTGVPHIDVEYAGQKGISVISLASEQEFLRSITSTAEHTWGLLLALIRRVPWAFDSVKKGVWNRRLFPGPAMLSNLNLGIIGLGRLGRMVAGYGQCFGMRVRYSDPYVTAGSGGSLERIADLKTLVSLSDVVCLHVPHNRETEGLVSLELFESFKEGSFFVNTARAEVMDSNGLLTALESGRLGGAALDVFEGEFVKGFSGSEQFSRHPLLAYARSHENLLITPHIGGSTKDAWRATEEYTIQMLIENLSK